MLTGRVRGYNHFMDAVTGRDGKSYTVCWDCRTADEVVPFAK